MDPNKDSMQSAFEQFMLKGKESLATPSPPFSKKNRSSAATPSSSSSESKKNTNYTKRYGPILKAFQGKLQEWKDTNDHAEKVMGSIGNLRDRIKWETRLLQRKSSISALGLASAAQPWRGCGFRQISDVYDAADDLMGVEDIRLALDHDLIQHERMLMALRGLIASMAQTLDAMGRRLDEWMTQSLVQFSQLEYQGSNPEEKTGWAKEQRLLDDVQLVYSILAEDLYLKQRLVQSVLESCHDGLVEKDSTDEGTPSDVVKWSLKEWSVPTRDHVILFEDLLTFL
jgi:hypothetical protein